MKVIFEARQYIPTLFIPTHPRDLFGATKQNFVNIMKYLSGVIFYIPSKIYSYLAPSRVKNITEDVAKKAATPAATETKKPKEQTINGTKPNTDKPQASTKKTSANASQPVDTKIDAPKTPKAPIIVEPKTDTSTAKAEDKKPEISQAPKMQITKPVMAEMSKEDMLIAGAVTVASVVVTVASARFLWAKQAATKAASVISHAISEKAGTTAAATAAAASVVKPQTSSVPSTETAAKSEPVKATEVQKENAQKQTPAEPAKATETTKN